ncbi:hypothetical protein AAC387_Pa07g1348 [Persea americana]
MALSGIVESLENKSILVTGCTGFLAKVFVEKVLRIQPHLKRLFVLLRAADDSSANQRFQDEVLGKEVFSILKCNHGTDFDSFILEKVYPIAGDISLENLGIKEPHTSEMMQREINVIIDSAATTKFDERYDVALGTNTLGAKYVLEFAKKCVKLEMLLHVSTGMDMKNVLTLATNLKLGDIHVHPSLTIE